MRKRTISNLFDKVFWYLVLLLPIIMYLLTYLTVRLNINDSYNTNFAGLFSVETLDSFFSTSFSGFQDNVMYSAFVTFFGYFDGLTVGVFLPTYLSYCVYVEIAHVAFDFFVFIPRFCHKLVEKAVSND